MVKRKPTYEDLLKKVEELETNNSILKAQQIEINKAKELYLKIFEDFPALIWRSRLDKLCDYFNGTWLEFTGRTMEQEFGNGWAEGVHPDDFNFCLQTYVTAFDKREAFLMEYRMKNKFGEYRWISDFGRPFYDLDNTFLGYIGSCYDITDSKRNEQQLIGANADKDRFISILAHDLISPFNSLLGFSDMLLENLHTYDMQELEKVLRLTNTTTHQTHELLEQILMWAQSQRGRLTPEPQKFDFSEAANEVIKPFPIRANEKQIEISVLGSEKIILSADLNMFKTVLRNLISNAIKFTKQNGQINIYAEKNHTNAIITVSDNGIGIEEEVIPKLWETMKSYSTTGTNSEKGMGLGLTLCKELVEIQNGQIWVESKVGKGSDFKFTLPLCNY